MKNRSVYILLTRTNTLFSRVIHLFTGDEFTHAAIGVAGADGVFWGFGRKYPRLPFPGAFRKECPWRFKHGAPCRVYRVDVSEACYREICMILEHMSTMPEFYHYSILGVIACRLGIIYHRDRYFFCSQFVAWLLQESGAVELPVCPAMFRPSDFTRLSGATLEREGAWWTSLAIKSGNAALN